MLVASAEMSAGRKEELGSYSGPERRQRKAPVKVLPVRLIRKYAEVIDGVDLSAYSVGDRLPVAAHDARLLLAEGWAEPVRRRETDRS